MKNSKLLKSCLALSMVFGTNGYLMTNISAEGEEEEASDLTSTTSNSSEDQNIGGGTNAISNHYRLFKFDY